MPHCLQSFSSSLLLNLKIRGDQDKTQRHYERANLLSLVAVVEDVIHGLDMRRLGAGDQEGVAGQRPLQLVADVSAVLKKRWQYVRCKTLNVNS